MNGHVAYLPERMSTIRKGDVVVADEQLKARWMEGATGLAFAIEMRKAHRVVVEDVRTEFHVDSGQVTAQFPHAAPGHPVDCPAPGLAGFNSDAAVAWRRGLSFSHGQDRDMVMVAYWVNRNGTQRRLKVAEAEEIAALVAVEA